MNFELNEEQRMWRQAVHEFCAQEVKPKAAQMDAESRLDLDMVRKMGPLGLLGLNVPEEYGGAGVDAASAAVALEELGWACGSTALSVAAHNGLCCAPIALFGSSDQKARWLHTLASGEAGLGALALTEPGGGSDLSGAVKTQARLEGDEWVISGSKAWITNASLAPWIVTLCRTDSEAGSAGLSLIVVPGDAEGLHVHPAEKKLGTRASPTHALTFEGVRVPRDHMLGEPGQGLYQALETLDGGRVGIAALSVGLGRAALEEALRYANEREAFGAALAHHEAIQFMVADAATRLDAARFLVYRACQRKQMGLPFTKEAAMAKLFASEAAEEICRDAIQIFGGYGYSRDFPVERLYRDARLMTIGEGTSEIQRLVIGRRTLGLR